MGKHGIDEDALRYRDALPGQPLGDQREQRPSPAVGHEYRGPALRRPGHQISLERGVGALGRQRQCEIWNDSLLTATLQPRGYPAPGGSTDERTVDQEPDGHLFIVAAQGAVVVVKRGRF